MKKHYFRSESSNWDLWWCGNKIVILSWAWWRTSVIPALRRLRQEYCCQLEVSVVYKVRSRPPWTELRNPISKRPKRKRKWNSAILWCFDERNNSSTEFPSPGKSGIQGAVNGDGRSILTEVESALHGAGQVLSPELCTGITALAQSSKVQPSPRGRPCKPVFSGLPLSACLCGASSKVFKKVKRKVLVWVVASHWKGWL